MLLGVMPYYVDVSTRQPIKLIKQDNPRRDDLYPAIAR